LSYDMLCASKCADSFLFALSFPKKQLVDKTEQVMKEEIVEAIATGRLPAWFQEQVRARSASSRTARSSSFSLPAPLTPGLLLYRSCSLPCAFFQVTRVLETDIFGDMPAIGPNNAYLHELRRRRFQGIPWDTRTLVAMHRTCAGGSARR
jgi:hypothetical protein